jgi:CBS domain containing-hemolysin-like protein
LATPRIRVCPVYRETLDDPVGLAHIKDVLGYMSRFAEEGSEGGPDGWGDMRILPAIRRPLLYVPASMRAFDLLLKMQSRRMHMALVVDEFGGTDGLVTLEDLIEPIVGDIEDEHDEAETPNILAKGPHCWEADARAMIEDLEEVVGARSPPKKKKTMWTRSAGWFSTWPVACPSAARCWRTPPGLSLKCSILIRVGSSACA